jgi:hypothetical protein
MKATLFGLVLLGLLVTTDRAAAEPLNAREATSRPPAALLVPGSLDVRAPLSAALMTATGGPTGIVDRLHVLGDWDGVEDLTADHEAVEIDRTLAGNPASEFFTRAALSEHSPANGHFDLQFSYGDSVGNWNIDFDSNGDGVADVNNVVNVPDLVATGVSDGFALLNPIVGDTTSGSVVVTGIAVNPVADMSAIEPLLCDTIGEITYVAVHDATGGSLDGQGRPVKSRIVAFGTYESGGGAVFAAGAVQVLRSHLDIAGGLAVDDEGSLYFHLADVGGLTGAAVFKATEMPYDVCATAARVNRGILPFALDGEIDLATTSLEVTGVHVTNYSGTSPTFGNVVAMTNGPCNTLYAAVARSHVTTDDEATRATEGPFTNPDALGPTPSMVISLADGAGASDGCSSPGGEQPGILPIADGSADAAAAGLTAEAGVNNFRAFVLGNGPDPRTPGSPVFGGPAQTLKLDLQIDPTVFAGLAVDEVHAVSVISGGTPTGFGSNPSATRGEILKFPDRRPFDRRADFVDLRGDTPPDPPMNGGSTPDGDSDRFDHIFYLASPDGSGNPTGLAGLARGFLLYLNRNRDDLTKLTGLPNGTTLGDDATTGAIPFSELDPTEQVAGGDDLMQPLRGDDMNGGFEFSFAGPPSAECQAPWTEFYVSSNGKVTFGAGDTDNTPTLPEWLQGPPTRAPAGVDLNPGSRGGGNVNTFPVQAVGFADVNAVKVRWIDVPEFGREACGSRASLAVTFFDDGTGQDENGGPGIQEGPTDGAPRPDGSGRFDFEYCRMDLLGLPSSQVLVGHTRGGQDPATPNLGETDWSQAARRAALGGGFVGDGTKGMLFELFDQGLQPVFQTPGAVDFDLRFESTDPLLTTEATQPDPSRDFVPLFGADCNATDLVCAYEITVEPFAIPTSGDFDLSFTAAGGVPPFTFAVTGGALPDGVTLDADGLLSGASTVVGGFNVEITATDAQTCTGVATYAFSATCGAAASFGSIRCRLTDLQAAVDAVPESKTKRSLGKVLAKAQKQLTKGEEKAAGTKPQRAKRPLKKTSKALLKFTKKLAKKRAQKDLDEATRAALTAEADAIRPDVDALLATF